MHHRYVVFLEDDAPISRGILVGHLRRHGIDSMIHYPFPIYMQPLYKRLGYGECCPNLSRHAEGFKPPSTPGLSEDDIDYMVDGSLQDIAISSNLPLSHHRYPL